MLSLWTKSTDHTRTHFMVIIVDSSVQIGARIKAMVINQDKEKGRFSLSTKSLEPEPGDMVRNPQAVFDQVYSLSV